MVERALDTSEEVEPKGQIEAAEAALYRVAEEGGGEGNVKTFAQATRLAVQMAERRSTPAAASGITTGLELGQRQDGGLHHSDLIILAGRPGMGKSSLATNIAFASAQRFSRDIEDGIEPAKSAGAGVALFSLEMSADQLATRILAEQSGISSENLRMGKISQQDFRNLARAAGEMQGLPLYIDDTPGLTIAALRARARRLKRQKGIGMVVVDYLQLLQGTGRNSNGIASGDFGDFAGPEDARQGARRSGAGCRSSARGRAARGQEAAARRPSRIGLDRAGRRHGLVRLSRGILSHRAPAKRRPRRFAKWQEDMNRVYGLAEMIIAKQRHGATGKVKLRFEAKITRFGPYRRPISSRSPGLARLTQHGWGRMDCHRFKPFSPPAERGG